MASLPIVTYFRQSDPSSEHLPDWVSLSLLQARLSNPQCQIVLITDQKDLSYAREIPLLKTIELIDASELAHVLSTFRKIYYHISPVNFHHERTCIERWFLVNELVRKRGIEKFFFMDSDVLLYCDINEAASRFAGADATIISDMSWGSAYFFNPRVLAEFCDMVIEAFERKTQLWPRLLFELGLTHPDPRRHTGTNLCDMLLITAFAGGWDRGYPRNIVPCDLPIDGRIFDPHMNTDRPGVEMSNGIKHLVWSRGKPYVKLKNRNEYLKMDCLHFQGDAKRLLGSIFEYGLKVINEVNGEVENRVARGLNPKVIVETACANDSCDNSIGSPKENHSEIFSQPSPIVK